MEDNFGPYARSGFELQRPTDALRPLTHHLQAEVTLIPPTDSIHVESSAIILHPDAQLSILSLQLDADTVRPGVPAHVGQCLLNDTDSLNLYGPGDDDALGGCVEAYLDALVGLIICQVFTQCREEAAFG